jgi:F-type H+-transporting ATPase subunit epsilon
MAQLQLTIVTPESTTFDQAVDSVTLPLVDGESGILPNHAPMIGRLAAGELRAQISGRVERFYVEGGTVQVLQNVISVLTGKCINANQLNVVSARETLEQAEKLWPTDPKAAEHRQKAIAQAKAQIRIAEKG